MYSGTPPQNGDISVYGGTPLFQHHKMRTPLCTVEHLPKMGTSLYMVELLYSNTIK